MVAAEYDITLEALESACRRGKWPVASRLEHEARKAAKALETAKASQSARTPQNASTDLTHAPQSGPSNPRNAQELTLDAAKGLVIGSFAGSAARHAGLLAAATLSAPTDWKEFGQAARALGYMVGHNSKASTQNTQINVLVWPKGGQESGWLDEGGPIVEQPRHESQ
jgi:hypothetical protein